MKLVLSRRAKLKLAAGALGAATLGLPARAQTAASVEAAHCLLLPLPPAARALAAPLVVEAEVRSASAAWDAARRRIFTRHRLRVFAVLKGGAADTADLVLVTEGGQVGLDRQELTNTLRPLQPGQQGVFFLTPAPWPAPGGPAYAAYASSQGFVEYDLAAGTAAEPFRTYDLKNGLGALYGAVLGRPAAAGPPAVLAVQVNLRLRAAQQTWQTTATAAARGQAPTVDGFSPAQLAAGVGAVLTVRGNGFGSSRGSGFVEFRNADDGGATATRPPDRDYLGWGDTEIRVRVPSVGSGGHPAGSGPVRVTTAAGLAADSPAPLTVLYALTNVENTQGTAADRPNHVATNATGGLTFRFGPNFAANAAAVAAWQRALAQWRCSLGINWELGSALAANTIAEDNQNAIAFDAGSELPDRVLGRTTTYYRGCYGPTGELVFYVKEIDQQYDDGANFQFGPAPAVSPQIDFETVAVHELGHAQQLTHLNLPRAVMHYAVARGQNSRQLNPASDIAGGRLVLRSRSFVQRGCGGAALLPAPLTALAVEAGGTAPAFAFATRDECFLQSFVLERSVGADTTRWQPVATVLAGGGAGQYRLADPQPANGLRFYRLGLRRPDGTTDYAAPRPVQADATGPQLFPNPWASADGPARLLYPAAVATNLAVLVYDELGRYRRVLGASAQPGLNVLPLDLTGFTPGFYLVQIRNSQGEKSNLKLVVQ